MTQLSMFAPPALRASRDTARAVPGHAGSRLTTTVAYFLSGATLVLLAAFIGGL